MDRRKFLVSSGLVGVGVLGTGSVAPEINPPDLKQNHIPITLWRRNPWLLQFPLCRTRSTH